MGMPCEVNTVLKLHPWQGFPEPLGLNGYYEGTKQGYRIYPMDICIPLLDSKWEIYGLVRIESLKWEGETTLVEFKVVKVYEEPIPYEC